MNFRPGIRAGVLLTSILIAGASANSAAAFELFGIKLWGEDEDDAGVWYEEPDSGLPPGPFSCLSIFSTIAAISFSLAVRSSLFAVMSSRKESVLPGRLP